MNGLHITVPGDFTIATLPPFNQASFQLDVYKDGVSIASMSSDDIKEGQRWAKKQTGERVLKGAFRRAYARRLAPLVGGSGSLGTINGGVAVTVDGQRFVINIGDER